jgi:hypothetical protein
MILIYKYIKEDDKMRRYFKKVLTIGGAQPQVTNR